jgi:EpsI family protein
MIQRWGRFAIAIVLLVGTGWFLHARERNEIIPPHLPLATYPPQLQAWTGTTIPIDKETTDVLGPGDFLLRQYEQKDGDEPAVYLFVGYFPSQRTGDTMHSPKNCLPGAGWQPIENNRVMLQLAEGPPFPANQYVIEKGLERQLVVYWFQAQGRAVASEYEAKIELVLNAIRTNRTDGALIRFSTPMTQGEATSAAMARLKSLAEVSVPALDGFLPK